MSIKDYEFEDTDIDGVDIHEDGSLALHDRDYEISTVFIHKKDVVAMAKHYDITEQDLV